MSTPPCPVCGKPLEEIYQELKLKKPIYVCRNNGNCKGWFCFACDTYHPWGTSCAVEMVHDMRRNRYDSLLREFENFVNSQSDDALNNSNKTNGGK